MLNSFKENQRYPWKSRLVATVVWTPISEWFMPLVIVKFHASRMKEHLSGADYHCTPFRTCLKEVIIHSVKTVGTTKNHNVAFIPHSLTIFYLIWSIKQQIAIGCNFEVCAHFESQTLGGSFSHWNCSFWIPGKGYTTDTRPQLRTSNLPEKIPGQWGNNISKITP